MDVDVPSQKSVRDALRSNCQYPRVVAEALDRLEIDKSEPLSEELRFWKTLVPQQQPATCGITLFSLENYPRPKVFNLIKRASNIYFERGFYSRLYDEMIQIWQDEQNTKRTKIILSGNAGTGKSWFQVYLVRRLLSETKKRIFRFVIRMVGDNFSLLDLDTCEGFALNGRKHHVEMLLSGHGKILYLYEPAAMVHQPPLFVEAPSLSTLSPRKDRIHEEYRKTHPHELYMPVGEYNEMEYIAEEEKLDLGILERNFEVFGGIFQWCLLFQTDKDREIKQKEVDAKCNHVTAETLRSIAAHIDDHQDARQDDISGFVCCYTDIPTDGDAPFKAPSLTLTSHYVRQRLTEKMTLASLLDNLRMLANVLNNKSGDPSGLDLEASVVHMLSAGPRKVRWQYQGVPGEPDTSLKGLAGHSKRKVTRDDMFNPALVNYPIDKSYPLADCVLVIQGVPFAFQTTWQKDHAFKLRTLRLFRDMLGLLITQTLNICFVNPNYTDTYARRPRNNYLAKGEDPSKPILDSNKNELMTGPQVGTMWGNTRILVALPEDKDWHRAITSVLGV